MANRGSTVSRGHAPRDERLNLDALVATTRERFVTQFRREPRIAAAPGRVNLIGEHTDYNDGFVLPMAIGRHVAIAFAPREDDRIVAHSLEFGETRELSMATLAPPGGSGWMDYVAAVAWALRDAGHSLRGVEMVVHGDVPVGAGLSSSAALELAAERALTAASGAPWDPVAMALTAQRAERAYVGVQCGVMDQMASAVSRDGCALLLDCRTLESSAVSIPDRAAVVVMDTGARRSLASSAYNDRRAACERAVSVLQAIDPAIRALRDATVELLASARDRMDPVVYRRALHVIEECGRPRRLADAFAAGDLEKAGRLMNESHESLRVLYEVSSAELDLICELAREHPACLGARMTGAGFGGCAIALVERDGAEDFIRTVHPAYEAKAKLRSQFFACRPVAGARILEG